MILIGYTESTMPVKNATEWESFALSQLNVLADKLAKLHMKEHRTSDTEDRVE